MKIEDMRLVVNDKGQLEVRCPHDDWYAHGGTATLLVQAVAATLWHLREEHGGPEHAVICAHNGLEAA